MSLINNDSSDKLDADKVKNQELKSAEEKKRQALALTVAYMHLTNQR